MKTALFFADAFLAKHPGGVKMVCSSVVVALMVWTIAQFGSKSILAVIEDATSAVKLPVQTIQSYLNADDYDNQRWRRAVRKIPPIDNREIESTLTFVQAMLNKMGRHEMNIEASNVKVHSGTPSHGHLIESLPTNDAFQQSKNAMVALKASKYLANKYCYRLGIDDMSCAKQIATLSMSHTSFGTQCAIDSSAKATCPVNDKFRTFDGLCNQKGHPAWGKAATAYSRILAPEYEDGFEKPRGSNWGKTLVSVRKISTTLGENLDRPDTSKTLAVMQWGQFISHDMSHTVVSKMINTGSTISCCTPTGKHLAPRDQHPFYCAPIDVSQNDPFYSKFSRTCMSYVRSMAAMRPDCKFGPLEQMNQATHYLDGSALYGSSSTVAKSLRAFWQGRMRTEVRDNKEFLPLAHEDSEACVGNKTCYASGDVRVNMQPGLAALHTLWVREHNRLAQRLIVLNPHWDDERLFQEARRIVVAQIQHITYNEWLPVVLGMKYVKRINSLTPEKKGFSKRYNKEIDASVSNSFATAAMRFIGSMVEGRVGLYQEDRNSEETVLLQDHYNKPNLLEQGSQLDALVRGMATQSSQKADLLFSEAVTNFLYKGESPFGLDQLSLDLQRGRDHGIPSYNQFRKLCRLREADSFEDLSDTIPMDVIKKLKMLYRNVDEVDLLVGGLAESHEDSLVGPTFQCIIAEQFIRTRTGDRFFYDNIGQPSSFSEAQLREIKKSTLSRVLCDNSDAVLTMQPYVFHKPSSPVNDLVPCGEVSLIDRLNLEPWREEKTSKL